MTQQAWVPSNSDDGIGFNEAWCWNGCARETYQTGGTEKCDVLTRFMLGERTPEIVHDPDKGAASVKCLAFTKCLHANVDQQLTLTGTVRHLCVSCGDLIREETA